ncbi:arginase family protein [Actinomadura rudentiformis]|uniref:Arginase family protein n=1 Tax=Actinomadura rudentiformis TaxID=359158 RepID=A0A6H9YY90_9ACTN|nr:arginase family protein [Actinomadura rudentiformis]KAB2346841.1 arginase family protein [Actinomadura rudentiformis]
MLDISVVEVPQWQGSGVPEARARRLADGAHLLAEAVPAGRRYTVTVPDEAGAETGDVRGLDVLAGIAEGARAGITAAEGEVVVTVGGDCGVELSPVSAAIARHGDALAVVWFDAHGDLNTPASSPSGAFHGMILRTLLGEGPGELVPARPLRPAQVVLAGVRALDPGERAYVEATGMRHVTVDALKDPAAVVEAVAATGARAVYVHIDLDVLDPGSFASLSCPEPGGITPAQLGAAVRALAGRFEIAGLGITEYQPDRPQDQETLRALVPGLLRGASGRGGRRDGRARTGWPPSRPGT